MVLVERTPPSCTGQAATAAPRDRPPRMDHVLVAPKRWANRPSGVHTQPGTRALPILAAQNQARVVD